MVDISNYTAKIVAIFVVLGITFTCGVMPIWLLKVLRGTVKNTTRLRYYISLMNCFAGGVFLGTSILHLILESVEKVEESIPEVTYPLAGVLIGAGFFIVLTLEHIIGLVSKDDDNPFLDHGHDHGSHDSHCSPSPTSQAPTVDQGDGGKVGSSNPAFDTKEKSSDEARAVSYRHLSETSFSVDISDVQSNGNISPETKRTMVDISGDGRSKTQKGIRTLILVIALSIHMIFEGMAIGLQDSDSSTWTLMAAISVHKAIIVFSVGLKMKEIIEGNIKIILYILYLSAVSPAGIALGLVISITGSGNGPDHNSTCVAVSGNCSTDTSSESEVSSAQDISSGILQSLASGTFLYVTFFEILQNELSHGYSLLKVFLTLLGFGAMAGLKVLDAD